MNFEFEAYRRSESADDYERLGEAGVAERRGRTAAQRTRLWVG